MTMLIGKSSIKHLKPNGNYTYILMQQSTVSTFYAHKVFKSLIIWVNIV
jgi:hypothetical protein